MNRALLLLLALTSFATPNLARAQFEDFDLPPTPWEKDTPRNIESRASIQGQSDHAKEANETHFVFSAYGPGKNQGAFAIGGRAFVLSSEVIVPLAMVELAYTRELATFADLDVHLSTLVIGSLVELGVRWKLYASSQFSIAAKSDVLGGLLVVGGTAGAVAGGTIGGLPGLLFSFGSEKIQLSVGCDLPMFLGGGAASSVGIGGVRAELVWALRPSLTLELPVGDSTNLFFQAQSYIVTEGGVSVLPSIATGAAW